MTKKILLCLLILLATFHLYSQSKLSYYIEIAPTYSYRNYKLVDYSVATNEIGSGKVIYDFFQEKYNDVEEPTFKYTFSAGINYDVSERFSFKTGLSYKNIGENVSYETSTGQYEYGNIIVPVTETSYNMDFSNSYHYLGIPIEFNYRLISRDKVTFGIIIGFDLDLLLADKITNFYVSSSEADMKYHFSNTSFLATNIHGGFTTNISLGDKIGLFISPQFSKYITQNVSYDVEPQDGLYCKINQYNYYGQLKIGIVYKK